MWSLTYCQNVDIAFTPRRLRVGNTGGMHQQLHLEQETQWKEWVKITFWSDEWELTIVGGIQTGWLTGISD